MESRDIARVCHEANRAVQTIQADPSIPVSPPWDETDPETQRSAVVGVEGILAGNDPEQSHESWVTFKREHGWVHGPTKDEEAKTHPLLVPYADLPEEQRLKDRLFHSIVHALSDG